MVVCIDTVFFILDMAVRLLSLVNQLQGMAATQHAAQYHCVAKHTHCYIPTCHLFPFMPCIDKYAAETTEASFLFLCSSALMPFGLNVELRINF